MSLVVKFYLAIKRTMSGIFIESKFSAESSRFAKPSGFAGFSGSERPQQPAKQEVPKVTEKPETKASIVFEKEISLGKRPTFYTPSTLPQRFVDYYTATLKLEGDVAIHPNDPSDPGGATSWGISSKAHPDLADRIARGLSRDEAFEIAYERYYQRIPFLDKVDPRIGFVIFDARFHGMKENVYALQVALNNMGYTLSTDSVPGKLTMYALSQLNGMEADVALRRLSTATHQIAVAAANRAMEEQRRLGLPVKNYRTGFINRQEGRLRFASTMKV